MKNERGQMIVETILILVVLVSMVMFVSRKFKDDGLVQSIVSGPWKSLAGLIETGEWKPAADARKQHPNHHIRHVSYAGDRDL